MTSFTRRSRGIMFVFLTAAVLTGGSPSAQAQTPAVTMAPEITTVAGNGNGCAVQTDPIGDGCPAGDATLIEPSGIAFDPAGNLYTADLGNQRIRKVSAARGIITTVAGNGTQAYGGNNGPATTDNLPAIDAVLDDPVSVAADSTGNLYIADFANNRIRKVSAATGIITTVVGTGAQGYSGDNGPATSATLSSPSGVAVDSAGNLYIADSGNNVVRKVNAATGIITTAAGNGARGYSGDGGPATSAGLGGPGGLAVDSAGNLYISIPANFSIRKVSAAAGIITTVAGYGTQGYSGDNGPATNAELSYPAGIALDSAGNLYIADYGNNVIRMMSGATGVITTVVGSGTGNACQGAHHPGASSGDGGPANQAALNCPAFVAVDSVGSLYIEDNYQSIRKVFAPTAPVSFPETATGSTSASQNVLLAINSPLIISSISVPQSQGGVQEFTVGSVAGCVADGVTTNAAGSICTVPVSFQPGYPGLRRAPLVMQTSAGSFQFGLEGIGQGPQPALLPGIVTTVAGNGVQGYSGGNGPATSGDNGPATAAQLDDPGDVAVDSAGNLYIADFVHVWKVTATGVITTIAGTSNSGYSGDNGPAASAEISGPTGIGLDSAGNLYIGDQGNQRVRRVSAATGIITTVAGTGTPGYSGDNGPATSAELDDPTSISVDSGDNLYILDRGNYRIRKVSAATGVITTVAGTGTQGYSGDNGPATSAGLDDPAAIAVDSTGNLFIADGYGDRVRRVDAVTGVITTVAGNGIAGYGGDNGPATSAQLNVPGSIAVDAAGNLYIADGYNYRLRKVNAATGVITTVAGSGTDGYGGDNGPATEAAFNALGGVALDPLGNLYIADTFNERVRKLSVTTSPLIFPAVGSNSVTAPQTFTLANIGNTPLNLSAITPTANFNIDGSTTTCSTSSPLATGDSCEVGVVFYPTAPGSVGGTLTLTDNSLNLAGSTQQVSLSGAGTMITEVNFQLSPATDFPYGQGVNLTANVIAQSGPAPSTGAVIFSVDGNAQPAIPLGNNGTVSLQWKGLQIGWHQASASYGGSTDGNYSASSNSIPFQISQAFPTLSWTPATHSQVYGSAVGAGILNASVIGGMAGVISYTATPSGGQATAITAATVLPAGSYTLTATFTPTDTTDYTRGTSQASYIVNQATPIITWASPAAITSGAALSSKQLNATANVAGTFAYAPTSGSVLNTGPQTLSVTFTPADIADYKAVKAQVSMRVAGVSVSSPPSNSTVSSPVQFIASATPSSSTAKIKTMKIYVDNAAKYSVNAPSINTKLKLSSGAHHITVQAWDSTGLIYKNSFVITVH